MRHRSLALATIVFLLVPSSSTFAFVDSDALSENLQDIERELSGDTGLGSLLDELEEVAEQSGAAEQYLRFTHKGDIVTFWDVPKNAWFYGSTLALVELGIVSGKEDASGTITGYEPAGNVSRPAALKMALLAAGVNTDACSRPSRSDVIGHWAEAYVGCAEQMDLGLGNKSLGESASRAEVLHYVLKAFGISAPEGNPPFSDSKYHQYKNDIAYAYALEIVSGDDGAGTFRPDDNINRAEVAKIVKLAIELL